MLVADLLPAVLLLLLAALLLLLLSALLLLLLATGMHSHAVLKLPDVVDQCRPRNTFSILLMSASSSNHPGYKSSWAGNTK